jgi:pimeloyl-ACP methyl ester carboxylesterase
MRNVVILHGYSDNRQSFVPLQQFLGANGFAVTDIVLGDYISLEDHITIEDLAKAFQTILPAKNMSTAPGSMNLIVHSTGALVAREWLTRYYLEAGKECPLRRFLMLAPANFGSPLAALGRTMFGRIVKGWRTNFETGTHILEALEMGSTYSWKLAQRDLFGPRSFYVPDTCLCAILVGGQPYQDALRQLVDKNGSDGTVYVCTANLNATGLSLRFAANSQVPTLQSWPKSARPIPFAVFPNRDHASIVRPDTLDPELGNFILKFLRLDLTAQQEFASECDARTRQTLPPSPASSLFHTFQNLVSRVADDLGMSIPDYFLEFYEHPHTPEEALTIDDLMVKVHNDVLQYVHNYKRDESYRSFIFDLTTLNGALANGEELVFSLSAANPSNTIGYSIGNANSLGELPVDINSPSYPLFWRPNETLLMDITVERTQDARLFQLY